MLTVPAPASFEGDALASEMRSAGLDVDDDELYLRGPDLVFVSLEEADRAAAQKVIDAHTPPPPPPDPDDELDAALASAAAKTTVEEKVDAVIAALRGKAGRQGAAAGRRPT